MVARLSDGKPQPAHFRLYENVAQEEQAGSWIHGLARLRTPRRDPSSAREPWKVDPFIAGRSRSSSAGLFQSYKIQVQGIENQQWLESLKCIHCS